MEQEDIEYIIARAHLISRQERLEIAERYGYSIDVVNRALSRGLSKRRGFMIRLKILIEVQSRLKRRLAQ